MSQHHSALADAQAAAGLLACYRAAYRLPRGDSGDIDTYLGVLDRVLEDRIVSTDELLTISGLAIELGLKYDAAQRAHRQYLQHLATAAWTSPPCPGSSSS